MSRIPVASNPLAANSCSAACSMRCLVGSLAGSAGTAARATGCRRGMTLHRVSDRPIESDSVYSLLAQAPGQVSQLDRLAQVPAVQVGAVDEQLVVPEEPACRTVPGPQLGVGQAAVEPVPLLPGQGSGLRGHRLEAPLTDDERELL